MGDAIKEIKQSYNNKLVPNIVEITIHLVIALYASAAIYVVERTLIYCNLEHRIVKPLNITMDDFMFTFEMASLSVILSVSIIKVIKENILYIAGKNNNENI